jgi:hypothetical protein
MKRRLKIKSGKGEDTSWTIFQRTYSKGLKTDLISKEELCMKSKIQET